MKIIPRGILAMIKKIIPKIIGGYLNTLAYLSPSSAGEKGFYIFCTPIVPPVKKHHHQFLSTAHKFSFESDGLNLQCYRWGRGEKKIVFLHGWQSHSFRWKKYVEAFSFDEYSLFAFDAPAHGLSRGKYINISIYGKAIKDFLKEIGGADTLVSHSMGSFSVLYALHNNPNLDLQKLILMGSPGEASDFVSFFQNATGINDRTLGYILKYFRQKLNLTPDDFSAPKFASSIRIPGLIIHDEDDAEAPYIYAQQIHKAWPQSKLISTKGYGHNLKVPEVVEMVKEFVMEKTCVQV